MADATEHFFSSQEERTNHAIQILNLVIANKLAKPGENFKTSDWIFFLKFVGIERKKADAVKNTLEDILRNEKFVHSLDYGIGALNAKGVALFESGSYEAYHNKTRI